MKICVCTINRRNCEIYSADFKAVLLFNKHLYSAYSAKQFPSHFSKDPMQSLLLCQALISGSETSKPI